LTLEIALAIASVILLVAILTSKLAARSGVPVLLLFLAFGMLLGSEGLAGIHFDNPALTQSVGVVALVVILFSGGLGTRWQEVAPVVKEGLLLSTIGVALTALSVGLFAAWVLQLTMLQGFLLGAIISSTDAAAVFSVLRGRGLKLRPKVKSILELESGSNDPTAVLLTIGAIQLITGEMGSPLELLPLFALQMSIGAILGVLFGRLALMAVNRLGLEYDGLYPVLTLSLMLLTYGATTILQGNGFLAVYIAGLVMGRRDFIHRRSLIGFHDGLAWLMQIIMFLTLGLQVFPSQVAAIVPQGLLIAGFLIVVARPISVFIGLLPVKMDLRERVLISWVGMRGAAPIILATFPLVAGLESASLIFNVVFFVVLASVTLQGTTISFASRRLGLIDDTQAADRKLLPQLMDQGNFQDNLLEINLDTHCSVIGRQVLDLNLPPDVLLMLIHRQGEVVVPRGATRLEQNDRLLLLTTPETRESVVSLLTT
jgi:cell volume regulation protein A